MKKAIVIGASSGIGRELARQLDAAHYSIAIVARRIDLLDELQNELPNCTHVKQLDVTDTTASAEVMADLIQEMGGVDLIVFAAGTGELNECLDWTLERATIATNVVGFSAVANMALRHFIEKRAGHFVAISSIAAIRGGRTSPAYNASKAFISNYLEGLRQKVAHLKLPITITDIKPGFIDTAMAKGEGLFWVASTEKAASQIYRAIRKRKSQLYVSKRWRLIAWLLRIMPSALYNRL